MQELDAEILGAPAQRFMTGGSGKAHARAATTLIADWRLLTAQIDTLAHLRRREQVERLHDPGGRSRFGGDLDA